MHLIIEAYYFLMVLGFLLQFMSYLSAASSVHSRKLQSGPLENEAQGPYRSPEYHATENAFNLNACYNHMPNS
jgi:hypothetical protein